MSLQALREQSRFEVIVDEPAYLILRIAGVVRMKVEERDGSLVFTIKLGAANALDPRTCLEMSSRFAAGSLAQAKGSLVLRRVQELESSSAAVVVRIIEAMVREAAEAAHHAIRVGQAAGGRMFAMWEA